jgi:hypothetical protein
MLARHAKLSAIPIIRGIEMTTSPALTVRLRDRRFYLFIAVLTAAIVFAGFARTFFLNGFFAKLPLPSLYILHGLVFSSWLVLLVTQSALISAKQIRIHQKLGYASIAIVVSMFSLGWIMSVQAAQRGFTPPGGPPPLSFLAFQILGLVLFTALVIAGFLLRNRPQTHKRLMVVGTVTILTPALARLFLLFNTHLIIFKALGVQLAILLICIAYDFFARNRVHPAYIWGSLAFVAFVPLAIFVGDTRAWLALAHWITGV